MPTARAPTGRRRKSAPSSAVPPCACASRGKQRSASARPITTSERRRLIDQHDRDVVAYGVSQRTGGTEETLLPLTVLQLTLALRADEDGEQLRGDAHLRGSLGMR